MKTGQLFGFLSISWLHLYYMMQFVCGGDCQRQKTLISSPYFLNAATFFFILAKTVLGFGA